MGTSSMRAAALCAVAAAGVFAATATPSSNDYASVTGDWARGDYTNVYEWAQARLAADTNDLPAAYVMVEYDVAFSDFSAMSNSILRMMRLSDAATLPAFTNLYQMTRQGWVYYLDTFLPQQSEAERTTEQQKSYLPGRPLTCSPFLKIMWDNGLW